MDSDKYLTPEVFEPVARIEPDPAVWLIWAGSVCLFLAWFYWDSK